MGRVAHHARAGREEVRTRLQADPWKPMKLLEVGSVEPWVILLGDPRRLARATAE